MPHMSLESELEALTRDFVAAILRAIRNASVADVAGVAGATAPAPRRAPRAPEEAAPKRARATRRPAAEQDALADRVLGLLSQARAPMGARAIASELGVPADRLAAPLKVLRETGRVRKLGDKRATTYAAA
jgi:hypothetical protein